MNAGDEAVNRERVSDEHLRYMAGYAAVRSTRLMARELLAHRTELPALLAVVEAARKFHTGEMRSEGCGLCDAMARLDRALSSLASAAPAEPPSQPGAAWEPTAEERAISESRVYAVAAGDAFSPGTQVVSKALALDAIRAAVQAEAARVRAEACHWWEENATNYRARVAAEGARVRAQETERLLNVTQKLIHAEAECARLTAEVGKNVDLLQRIGSALEMTAGSDLNTAPEFIRARLQGLRGGKDGEAERGTPHRCPVCDGGGLVMAFGSLLPDTQCPVCKGHRVIWSGDWPAVALAAREAGR